MTSISSFRGVLIFANLNLFEERELNLIIFQKKVASGVAPVPCGDAKPRGIRGCVFMRGRDVMRCDAILFSFSSPFRLGWIDALAKLQADGGWLIQP